MSSSEDLNISDNDYNEFGYQGEDGCDFSPSTSLPSLNSDPEFIEFSCFDVPRIKAMLTDDIVHLSEKLGVDQSLSKLLLCLNHWDFEKIASEYVNDPDFLSRNNICSSSSIGSNEPQKPSRTIAPNECLVCLNLSNDLLHADCRHKFCRNCWIGYIETQISNGVSLIKMECMNVGCHFICREEFILMVLRNNSELRAKYEELIFRECVQSNPYLGLCPGSKFGSGCPTIIYCKTKKPSGVQCSTCLTKFCIKCGLNYHAPSSCEIIKKWLVKCADDSETANYISANTKDCPNCHSCIEKNGGCNHMQCLKCKHHFCWMCFRDWKTHGNEYYECSRYKENPAIAQEANHLKARRALERYLHYYERYENHNRSLKMEEDLRTKIRKKIEEKVNNYEGTWIDWQYLHEAATLLTKCRYTLQYTYPLAYFMENEPRKELFEYQQAQLEKEIEELSWKVERAEHTDRGDLENQMHVAELKRLTLLQGFF